MKQLTNTQEVDQLLELDPAVLFKHSTQCPISGFVLKEVERFGLDCPDVPVFVVHVIENREVSDYIEDKAGVKHESPQALVVRQGVVTWHGSHFSIDARVLKEQVGVADP